MCTCDYLLRSTCAEHAGAAVVHAAATPDAGAAPARAAAATAASLPLAQFRPRSMLHTARTEIRGPRYPVIDLHTHLSWSAQVRSGVATGEPRRFFAAPQDLLPVMDAMQVRLMVNLTGGSGHGLADTLQRFDRAAPGRFLSLAEPSYGEWLRADYPRYQADAIGQAKAAGAVGLKILKTLGLYLREGIDAGALVRVDDPRFDPMWEACAAHDLPVFIHTSDPEAFFEPVDGENERYDELGAHPDWSFHGRDFPSNAELLAARDRVIARHPKTRFVLLHVSNAENLDAVAATLQRFPNTCVDIAARIGELGRQPRAARRFFDRHQDRICFGTDAIPPPAGEETPQQVFCRALYEIYYRFLETEDEYFDYAPAPVPPQGRWRIYGLGLPDAVLRKVYHDNAARVLGLAPLPT